MALTRRALRTEIYVLERNLQYANAEVARLEEQVANLLGQKAPSYDERIRLARRAEDAEARAETAEAEAHHWRTSYECAARKIEALADRFPDFPRSIP